MPETGQVSILQGTASAVIETNFRLDELSWAPNGLEPFPWKIQAPGILANFACQYYPVGYHARRTALEKQSDLAQLPVLRKDNFVRNFADEFIVAKARTHAAIIHAGPIADPAATNASLGFGGGALSAFWTPEIPWEARCGIVALIMRRLARTGMGSTNAHHPSRSVRPDWQ